MQELQRPYFTHALQVIIGEAEAAPLPTPMSHTMGCF